MDENPLKDKVAVAKWLLELDDIEVIGLVSSASAELKRRNLLSIPKGPQTEKMVSSIVKALVGN